MPNVEHNSCTILYYQFHKINNSVLSVKLLLRAHTGMYLIVMDIIVTGTVQHTQK